MSKECTKKRTRRIWKAKHPTVIHKRSALNDNSKQVLKCNNGNYSNNSVNNAKKGVDKDEKSCITKGDHERDARNLISRE